MDRKNGRVDLRFSQTDLESLDAVMAFYGFKSRYQLAKMAVRLVVSKLRDNLLSCRSDEDDIDALFSELSGGAESEEQDALATRAFYRAVSKTERHASLPPCRGLQYVHPFARRFIREEYSRLHAHAARLHPRGISGSEDVMHNTLLHLIGKGDNGCSTYDKYCSRALKIFLR